MQRVHLRVTATARMNPDVQRVVIHVVERIARPHQTTILPIGIILGEIATAQSVFQHVEGCQRIARAVDGFRETQIHRSGTIGPHMRPTTVIFVDVEVYFPWRIIVKTQITIGILRRTCHSDVIIILRSVLRAIELFVLHYPCKTGKGCILTVIRLAALCGVSHIAIIRVFHQIPQRFGAFEKPEGLAQRTDLTVCLFPGKRNETYVLCVIGRARESAPTVVDVRHVHFRCLINHIIPIIRRIILIYQIIPVFLCRHRKISLIARYRATPQIKVAQQQTDRQEHEPGGKYGCISLTIIKIPVIGKFHIHVRPQIVDEIWANLFQTLTVGLIGHHILDVGIRQQRLRVKGHFAIKQGQLQISPGTVCTHCRIFFQEHFLATAFHLRIGAVQIKITVIHHRIVITVTVESRIFQILEISQIKPCPSHRVAVFRIGLHQVPSQFAQQDSPFCHVLYLTNDT